MKSTLLLFAFAFFLGVLSAQNIIKPSAEKLAQPEFPTPHLIDNQPDMQPCNGPSSIACGQLLTGQTTVGFTSNFFSSSYAACTAGFGSNAYNAADRLYTFTLSQPTLVHIAMEMTTSGIDLDMYLLSNCSPAFCITGSAGSTNYESVLEYLAAGTYWIVVDGFNGSQGGFNLQMSCSCNCVEDTEVGRLIGCENFEDYVNNDSIAAESVKFRRWLNNAADGTVKTEGTNNYLRLAKVGTYEPDVIYHTGRQVLDRYRLSFKMKVEAGKYGNYYVLHSLPDGNGSENSAYRVLFTPSGVGYVRMGTSSTNVATFNYSNGEWVNIVQIIDVGNDRVDLWIGGEFVHSWAFHLGSNGSQFQLEGVNFDAHFVDYAYQVDDICFRTTLDPCFSTTEFNPVCIENGESPSNASVARCLLFTGDEMTPCTNVCDFAGQMIYRGDNYSGSFTASDVAPASVRAWPCVQAAYSNNVPPALFADIYVFSAQDNDVIGVGFQDNGNPNVRGFVFVCSYNDVNVGVGAHGNSGPDQLTCIDGENCYATLTSGTSTSIPVNTCANFYYVVITGVLGETYSNLSVIPTGACDPNPPVITCGQTISGSISGSPDPDFQLGAQAYGNCYNGNQPYTGGESFYKFTLTQPSRVTIDLTATGAPAARMGVFLYSFLCGENCVGYAENTAFSPSATLSANLSAGIYYLVVDKSVNSGTNAFNLTMNCAPYTSFVELDAFITNDFDCPTDQVTPPHLVKLNYSPNYAPTDLITFYFRNPATGQLKGNLESTEYWHNSTQPQDFNLRLDDEFDIRKCSYLTGDTFFVFVYQNIAQAKTIQYQPTFAPVSGGGVTDSLKFRPGGLSLITKLTPIEVVNFAAETSQLSTGPNATTLPLRFVTNQHWAVEETPPVSWLTVDPTTASTSKILSLTFQENPTVFPRVTYLNFYAVDDPDLYRQYVKVEQQGQCLIPQPVNIVTANTNVCQGTPTTLTADVGAQYVDLYNYLWSTGETTPSITVAPNSNTTYSVSVTNKYCFITSTDAQAITVTTRPNAPTPAIGNTMCAGQAAVPVSVGAQGPGIQVFWFAQPSGGVALNGTSSTSFTPSPAPGATTIYYAESVQNGCKSLTRTPVTLTVTPQPTFLTTDTICNANLLTYRVVVTLSNGNTVTTTPTYSVTFANGQYTIDNIPKGTNITLTASNASCSSTKQIVSPVCTCSFVANPVSSGDKSYCVGGTPPTLLVAVGNGLVAEWYNQVNGGTLLWTGTSYQSPGVGTYWVQAKNAINNCTSNRIAVQVTQQPLPTFSNVVKACANDLNSYFVEFTTTGNTVTAPPYTATNLGNGNFRISGITPGQPIAIHLSNNATTCSRDTLVEAPVCSCPDLPAPTTTTPLVNPCANETAPPLTVSVPANMSANWYRNGQLQAGSPTLSFSAVTPGDYWAKTVQLNSICESDDSTKVTLQYKPLPTIQETSKLCNGPWTAYQVTVASSSATLTSSLGILPSNNGNGTFTFSGIPIASNITVTATLNGCSASTTITPPVCQCTAFPSAPQNPNNPSICLGDDIPFLTVTVSNPATEAVDWYDVPNGGSPLVNNSPVTTQYKPATATTTKTYYAQSKLVENGFCISARTPVTLKVDLPATAYAGPNATVCSDEDLTLNGSIGGSAATGTWSAQPLGGAFSPNSSFLSAQQYSPPNNFQSGNITLTLTAFPAQPSVCPSVSDQMVLSVKQTPVVSILAQECEPDLNHSYFTFTTSGDDIEFVPNVGILTVNPDGSYTYGGIPEGQGITVTSRIIASNCDYTLAIPGKICECPTNIAQPNSLGNKEVCVGAVQMPTLEVSVPNGFTVDWYNVPFNGVPIKINDPTFENPPGPGDYWAETKNIQNSCTSMQRTLVKLTQVQLPNADAGLDQFVCPGNTVTLNAVLGGANYLYSWNTGQSGATITVPFQTATYILTVSLADCSAKDTVKVTTLPGAAATITQTHGISCTNSLDGSLTANGTGGNAPYSYVWSNSSIGQTISSLGAGTYTVVATNAEGCTASASSTLTNPNPIVLAGSTIQNTTNGQNNGAIQVSIAGGVQPYQYEWLLSNGVPIAGQTTNQLAAIFAGDYRVRVTDANGCTFLSAILTVLNTVGTSDPAEDLSVQVFPNPTSGNVFVRFELPEAKLVKIEAYDMLGRLITAGEEMPVKEDLFEINLEQAPAGLYLLKINLSGLVLTRTVSIKR